MKSTVFSVLLLVLSLGIVAAADKDPDKKQGSTLSKGTALNPQYGNINIGTIGTWHRADGQANQSPGASDGTTFPSGRVNVIYQDGIIWGGKMFTDAGLTTNPPSQTIRVGGTGTYSISTRTGNVTGLGATAVRASETGFRVWRIRRDFIEASDAILATDAAGVNEKSVDRVTAAEIAEVRAQYVKDWAEWPIQYGAPYVDRDSSGTWNPVAGWENMGGEDLAALGSDEPGLAGADPNSPADQIIWMVFNDLDTDQSKVNYGSLPLGLEVQKTVWGYKRTDALGKSYFAKYKIINKGGVLVDATNKGAFWIDSMYVAQWSDPDLGDAGNDVSGTDTSLSLGYTYNGAGTDANFAKFGLPHAAVGYDFLQGPIKVGVAGDTAVFDLKYLPGFVNLPMTSFSYFAAGGDYTDPPRGAAQYNGGTGQWWQLLRGFAPTATLVGAADKNFPTPPGFNPKYIFPSDPESQQGTGWIDGGIGAYTGTDPDGLKYSPTPGDRRIILASGPFLLSPGDTQEIVVGTLAAFGANRFSSVTALKGVDQSVQSTYDLLFQVTRAPAAPNVVVAELDGQVILEWASDQARVDRTENEINQPGDYAFEGYNVYQFPTLASQLSDAHRLATYDLVNGILTVFDRQFVPEYGTETDIAIQFGKDAGIQRTYVFGADAVNGVDRLYNGSPYYVGVTAYSVTPVTVGYTKALESSPSILTVRPAVPYATTLSSSVGDTVAAAHSAGSSDGGVYPIVIDPKKVTGDSYRVTFAVDPGDPAAFLWTLTNTTKSQVVMADQTHQGDDGLHAIVDGLQVKVVGPPVAINNYTFAPSAARWFTGVNWGGAQFFGGLDLGSTFWGPNTITPDELVTVEIRFHTNLASGQNAYMYLRGGTPSYGYVSYAQQYFTVWDVTSSPERQLAVAYVEQAGNAANNNLWQPTASNADREYLFIFNTDYTAAPDAFYTSRNLNTQGDEFPTLYAMWPLQRGTMPFNPQDGQVFRITPNFANTNVDEFTFNTSAYAPVANQASVAASIERVNVFPNPYYGVNPLETNRFQRFVTFNNLPPKAKV
ncbi:MAG: hypothetical protein WEE20_08035, partial [Bacteroidota bacterium]